MIIVEGWVRFADAGGLARVREAAEAQMRDSRAELGCLDYTYAIDVSDPCVMRVFERWEDQAALDAHFARPHMAPWRAALQAAGIAERNIHAHEVGATRKV